MSEKEIKKVLSAVLLSTAVVTGGFVGCSKSKDINDINNNNLSFDHGNSGTGTETGEENNNTAGIIKVKYNENSRYYEGGGLRFKIFEETGKATIIRAINFIEDYNTDLQEVSITAIKKENEDKIYPVTEVQEKAFYKCKALKKVELPNVVGIGNEAFVSCSELDVVILPNLEIDPKVDDFGHSVFVDCDKINYFELQSIGLLEYMIENNDLKLDLEKLEAKFTGKEEKYEDGSGIIYELNHQDKTAKVIGVKKSNTVMGDVVLDKVSVYRNDYDIIEVRNFNVDKRQISSLTLGEKVIGIGANGCTLYGKLYLPPKEGYEVRHWGETNKHSLYSRAYVKDDRFGVCKEGHSFKVYRRVVKEGVEYCVDRDTETAKLNRLINEKIKDLIVPDSIECEGKSYKVTKINAKAFIGKIDIEGNVVPSGLNSVTIGKNVETIEEMAFRWCRNLTSAKINAKNIGGESFSECRNLTKLELGDNVNIIGYSAFYGCESLGCVIIPNSVNCINGDAFAECNADIVLSDGTKLYADGDYDEDIYLNEN